jgi:quercetin dioxygenase-like cupin family protein
VHATWARLGPHRDGADLHVHRCHTDLFYVLDGELTVRLGSDGEAVAVPPGTLVRVPPLVVHGFRNGGDADVRYLNLHAPGLDFADYLRAARDGRSFSYDQHPPPPDGGRPATDAVIGEARLVTDRPGLRVVLLADVPELALSEVWCEPGTSSPPPHPDVASLYVLEGELTVTVAGRELRATPGSWVQVPAGVPRALAVTGDRRAHYLDVRTAA